MSKYALMVMLLLSGCVASPPPSSIARTATLHHNPQWILDIVAERMGVRMHPAIPVPEILFESATPFQRMQTAAARQWGFRPKVFANAYSATENRIYLIDDANFYSKGNRTIDDALSHEFVHYLQARYLKDSFKSEWSEAEALSVQDWFRKEYMVPILTVTAAH